MKPYQVNEYFGSTTSRINEFFHDTRMHYIFGQKECTLDTRAFMDDGGMLLVNLSGISRNTARVLGTMLIHDFFIEAINRPEWPEHSFPFYLIIDEAHLFMNEDIGSILNETRKFGLHLILSHQNLAQIRTNPLIYDGVMQSAQTKIVLGGATLEDAKLFAGEIFRFDPERLKSLTMPVTVGHERIWLTSESDSWSESSGSGESESESWSESVGDQSGGAYSSSSVATKWKGDGEPQEHHIISSGSTNQSLSSSSRSDGSSSNASSYWASSESETRGQSETLQPIIEERQMQTYSIEEQTYEAAVKLKFQPPQHAIVRKPDGTMHEVEIPFVGTPYVSPGRIERFREQTFASMPCMKRVEEVKQEIEERRRVIQQIRGEIRPIKSDAVFTLTEEERADVASRPAPVTIPISSLIQDDLE
jgi:hypothetical protein